MANQVDVTEADHVFIGEDKRLRFAISSDHAGTAPINVTGWSLGWYLRRSDKESDPALITKTTANGGVTLEGVYSADPAVNTLRVIVTLVDSDSYDPAASPPIIRPGIYRHSLKRLDDGSETVLTFGGFEFLQATAR